MKANKRQQISESVLNGWIGEHIAFSFIKNILCVRDKWTDQKLIIVSWSGTSGFILIRVDTSGISTESHENNITQVCKWIYERSYWYLNCGDMKTWLIIAATHTTSAVVKLKPEKNSGLNGIQTPLWYRCSVLLTDISIHLGTSHISEFVIYP